MLQAAKRRENKEKGKKVQKSLQKSSPDSSAYIPLTRTELHGHTSLQENPRNALSLGAWDMGPTKIRGSFNIE